MANAAIVRAVSGFGRLAGVGATSSVQFLVLGFCIGTSVGFCIPVAQKFGAKDYTSMRKYIFNGILLTFAIAVFTTILTVLLCRISSSCLRHRMPFSGMPISTCSSFYRHPFTLLYNFCAGILRAIGDSRTPFIFLCHLHDPERLFLDLFCILVLKWGVAGAAIATIVSQGISGILCAAVIIRNSPSCILKKMKSR